LAVPLCFTDREDVRLLAHGWRSTSEPANTRVQRTRSSPSELLTGHHTRGAWHWIGWLAVGVLASVTIGCETAAPVQAQTTTTGSLGIVDVSPPTGSEVTRDTVVVARLAFTVAKFEPDQYFLLAQFDEKAPGKSTDGTFPSSAVPVLARASGEYVFSFPLKHVWDLPEVRRPITMRFLLNRKISLS
jgi:hypothetical protein